MERWGKEICESERDKIKDEIHARLKELISEGMIADRAAIIESMKEMGLNINRAGKNYVSVKLPESGIKLRLRGGIYSEAWTPAEKTSIDESEEEQKRKARLLIELLEQDYERVIAKRAACNNKRYPPRWMNIDKQNELVLPVKEVSHEPDPNRDVVIADSEKSGTAIRSEGRRDIPTIDESGGGDERDEIGIAEIERYVRGCEKLVRELAEFVKSDQGVRVKQTESEAPRRFRMR